MGPIDHSTATARLQSLGSVVSAEYKAALDYALGLLEQQRQLVERERVVSMLTERAASCGYIALKHVLLEMAEAVSGL